ncbi:ribonuclease P protein subunit [Candidatus Woesearchaeota archaeon]|nr:ribonuclease P protein subunit [Candidatus Woesearchaeota archaeon]
MMYKGELIGSVVRVVDSCNRTLIGIRGRSGG